MTFVLVYKLWSKEEYFKLKFVWSGLKIIYPFVAFAFIHYRRHRVRRSEQTARLNTGCKQENYILNTILSKILYNLASYIDLLTVSHGLFGQTWKHLLNIPEIAFCLSKSCSIWSRLALLLSSSGLMDCEFPLSNS